MTWSLRVCRCGHAENEHRRNGACMARVPVDPDLRFIDEATRPVALCACNDFEAVTP